MKRRFSFLGNQSGEIILATMAIISIISIGWGLWSFGAEAQEAKQGIIDVTRYADSKNTADPNKAQKNNQAILVNLAVKGGKAGIDAIGGGADDSQIISVLDSCGAFNSPDKNKAPEQIKKVEAKKQNDIKTGETLKKNNLPAGQLTKDVVKGIQKIVDTNSKINADDKTKENAVISIISQILQDISDNKAKVPVIDTANKELDSQKILADGKTAKTKKDLNRALSEKEYTEKEIAAYDNLQTEGYLITDNNDLSYLKDRLDSTNKKIAKLEGELEALKQKENEMQGQNDALSQDSASESTAALKETATDEETVAIGTETDANLIHGVMPTLTQGVIAEKSDELVLFPEFFKTIQIVSSYSSEQDKYLMSGTNSAQLIENDGSITYKDNCTGEVSGSFDPLTGGFYGTFDYQCSDDAKDSVTGVHMVSTLFDMQGDFTGTSSPGDSSVKLTFHGTNHLSQGFTKNYVFNVTFTVEGALPFT